MKQVMMGWQWHQLDDMQIICTLLQTANHASTPPLIFTSQMLFLTPNQQYQSTEGNKSTKELTIKPSLEVAPTTLAIFPLSD